jgi:glycosyltransferase involved in cell wall biosynthesis
VNLLLINYEYPPVGGGAANATQALGRVFDQLGHRVDVLTSGLRGAAGVTEERSLRVHRLPVERPQADRATQGEMLAFLLQSRRAVPQLHRTHAFDAAIAFFTIPSGPAALRLHRLSGVPYAVSLRGGDVPGHVPGLGLKHILTQPLRRSVLRNAAAIVANSEGLAATSRAADPFPVHVIANGVDSTLFHPSTGAEASRADRRLRLLFVGRVHPEKNLGIVLRQLASLPPAVRECFELQIAGDGTERPELEALAGQLGLAAQVRWLGWQPKEAVPALYRSADALVNPSQYEGMPNSVLEAMASGLPILASDVPGNRSVVVPGDTGILFPLEQPALLGAALARLAADRSWGKAMGQAGRKRIEAEFSWLRTAQSYLELLRPVTPA